MKIKSFWFLGYVMLFSLFVLILPPVSSIASSQETKIKEERSISTPPDQSPPQEIQKPKLDYMSTFLSRNTSPLGLKENQGLRELLKQSKTKWAIRAGVRHILN
jgi:hypothetical protein